MYDSKHIYFLQYMLKNGCIPIEKAMSVCNIIHKDEANISQAELKAFIHVINTKIRAQDLKLIVTCCEVTGDTKVILVTTIADEVSKFQNAYTAIELKYFHLILTEIITAEMQKLEQIFCLNLASSLTPSLDYSSAERLLKKWITGGYLVVKDGFVNFGPRCVTEFTSYFRTECADYLHVCYLCSELVFHGLSCSECNKLLHQHCMAIFLRNQNKCPSCRKPWSPADMTKQPTILNDSQEGSDSDMSTD